MKLWHETTGRGQPLVLIHGWGMNSAIWDPVLDALNAEFQVTRVDLPGHGFSELSAIDEQSDQSLRDWARAMINVVPEEAIWLGWSLGGSVALQAALESHHNIKALFMMTATPSFAQLDDWPCGMSKQTLEKFFLNLEVDARKTLVRFLSLQIEGCEHSRDLLKQLRAGFSSRPAVSQSILKKGLRFLQHGDLRGQLKNIQLPVHWLFGERDRLVPACAAKTIPLLMEQSTLQVVSGAAHVPFLSHFPECFTALKKFSESIA